MRTRSILLTGFLTFSALFILSLIFYKERTVFTDIAFHLFYLAKEGDFAIQNNRFGAAFTQLFPLSAIWLNLQLNTVMLFYSAGFILYYFIVFLLILSLIKNKEVAVIMLLMPVLFVTHTFYWMQSELPQGLAFMLLCFAVYVTHKEKISKHIGWKILLIILVIVASGFHPIMIIPFVYICVFYFLNHNIPGKKSALWLAVMAVLFIAAVLIKSMLFKTSGYEASALAGLQNFSRFFPDYFTLESNRDFLVNCLRLYYFLPILLGIVLVYYYRHQQFRKFYLTLLFFFGYLLLINVCYHANTPVYYIENLYLPLGIFVLFPFVYNVLPTYTLRNQYTFIALIVFAGILRIYFIHTPYTTRYTWEENYIIEKGHRKAFIDKRLVPMDTLMDTWATPYEFWLLSTSQFGKSASLYVTDRYTDYYYHLPENKVFFLPYGAYPYDEFTGKYFIFTDTSRYTVWNAD